MAYETEDQETQYCFPDINSSCIKEKRPSYEYIILYVFLSLLSAWTVFLNLLVIISISHFKKLHTPTNLLIFSLAVNDLLIGLIVIPIEAIKLIEMCWYFGDMWTCGLFLAISGTLLLVSLSNLVLVAFDRYVAVCHPLQYPQRITTAKTLICVCLIWVCSSAYSSVFIFKNGHFDSAHRSGVCYGECSWIFGFGWTVTDLLLCFIFPCTLIITLYLRIFYVVHQQVKVINSLVKAGKSVTEGSVKRKSESKAALTLGIIVSVYLLCFIPYYICSVSITLFTIYYYYKNIINILLWAVYANSGLNPLVYALFYPWFKKTVKHILTLKIFHPASSQVNIFKEINYK